MRMKLCEYFDYLKLSKKPFLPYNEPIFSDFEYLKEYGKHVSEYDTWIKHNSGKRVLYIPSYAIEKGSVDEYTYVDSIVKAFLLMNKYKYEGLFKTMFFEYNPIENYNREEAWTDDTTSEGSRDGRSTVEYGEADSTVSPSKQHSNTTQINGVSAFDGVGGFNDSTKTETEQSVDEYTIDTLNHAHTDKGENHDSHEDIENKVHKGTVKGNIGVTTSQQMIESEREILNFSFFSLLLRDVVSAICIQIY